MVAIAPRALAFIAEANRVAPGRRKSSDGTYANKPGDHNVGVRGLVHAADLSLSMPGTPYWEPQFQQFDVHAWQHKIAAQYVAASVSERSQRWPWLYDGGYMHAYDAVRKVDIIFGPTVSLGWRVDNSPPSEHIQHGHFSIGHTVRSENDTQPIFTKGDKPVTEVEMDRLVVKLTPVIREQALSAVRNAAGGYVDGKWKDGALFAELRKDKDLAGS